MSIGTNRLRELRKKTGKSQETVGGLLGISQSRISDYENGVCAIPSDATEELVDIRSVSVNRDLPKEERIADFIRQIKNPYLFRCGKYTVRASFSENGQTLEECIKGLIR